MKLLDETLKIHITQTKTCSPGYEYYVILNPDFLISLAQAYFTSVGMKEMLAGQETTSPYVLKGVKLLENINKQIPGMCLPYLIGAKGKMAMG